MDGGLHPHASRVIPSASIHRYTVGLSTPNLRATPARFPSSSFSAARSSARGGGPCLPRADRGTDPADGGTDPGAGGDDALLGTALPASDGGADAEVASAGGSRT